MRSLASARRSCCQARAARVPSADTWFGSRRERGAAGSLAEHRVRLAPRRAAARGVGRRGNGCGSGAATRRAGPRVHAGDGPVDDRGSRRDVRAVQRRGGADDARLPDRVSRCSCGCSSACAQHDWRRSLRTLGRAACAAASAGRGRRDAGAALRRTCSPAAWTERCSSCSSSSSGRPDCSCCSRCSSRVKRAAPRSARRSACSRSARSVASRAGTSCAR